MFCRIKPYLLSILVLAGFSLGWRTTPATSPDLRSLVSMSLEGSRLLVSDVGVGIHVYDVSDPSAPVEKLVVPLGDNRSTASRGDVVYANDRDAILAIKLGADDSYEIVHTLRGYSSPDEPPVWGPDVIDSRDNGFGCGCSDEEQPVYAAAPPPTSTGSSYATFALIDEFLYYVDGFTLVTMDVVDPEAPEEITRQPVGWEIETLFPTATHLFIGGTRGMYIYDRTRPWKPEYVSEVQHFRACDPVVVEGDVAYVTLRGGNRCGETESVLLCIDIADVTKPRVMGRKDVLTPWGLTVDQSMLYVSTGSNGFELFDVTTPATPQRVKQWTHGTTRDFIWAGTTLYVMGDNDISIYDATDPAAPVLLSRIE